MCYIYKEDIGKERCIQMILDGHNVKLTKLINTLFTSSLVFLFASSWRVFLRLMMHMMKKATKIPNTTTTTAITASFWVPFSENINAVNLN